MNNQTIENLILKNLPGCEVRVDGDGTHFNAIVIYDGFSSLNRIQKQQLVYRALEDNVTNGNIHAISIKTYTEAQWKNLSEESN